MKKRNNQGFAISTILYGLLIMAFLVVALLMSIMASNRKNTTTFIDTIEEELNRFSDTSTDLGGGGPSASGDGKEYIVPYGKSGWYKIELWGAGGYSANEVSGKGSYTSGLVYLEENERVYFYIGESGKAGCTPYTTCNNSTFNGGGQGGYFNAGSNKDRYGSGGGATDVRLVNGNWDDTTSLNSRIMVAGGGGSTDEINTGSEGGTLVGIGGNAKSYGAVAGGGGGQSMGGSSSKFTGTFGKAGDGFIPNNTSACCNDAFGGGGGYFGGGGGYSGNPSYCSSPCTIRGYGGGGSSYISGYAGVNSITSGSNQSMTNNTKHYSGKYFVNGLMVPSMNEGTGRAKIELVSTNAASNPPTKKNSKLNNVRYIRDCINGNSINAANHWQELQALVNGVNVAKGKVDSSAIDPSYISDGIMDNSNYYTQKTAGNQCVTIDLGSNQNLDEVAVWHYYADNRQYIDHTLAVSPNNSTWNVLRTTSSESSGSAASKKTEPETADGIRYSAWQLDSSSAIPTGNYYIFSSLANNRVLTSQDSKSMTGTNKANVTLSLFEASKLQKWTVEKVDGTYYKIVETENAHSLQVSDGTGEDGANVNAATVYQGNDWELWRITPLGNGNYRLEPKSGIVNSENTSLGTQVDSFNLRGVEDIRIYTKTYTFSQRFTFVNAEY